jgi:hypothetical protein
MLSPAVPSDDIAAAATALRRPLLFLDTVAILDISRVPYRQELQVDIMESVAAMIDDLVANTRRVWVVALRRSYDSERYTGVSGPSRILAAGTRYSYIEFEPIHLAAFARSEDRFS